MEKARIEVKYEDEGGREREEGWEGGRAGGTKLLLSGGVAGDTADWITWEQLELINPPEPRPRSSPSSWWPSEWFRKRCRFKLCFTNHLTNSS